MASRRTIRKWSARASLAAHRHRHNLRRRPDLEILEDRIVLATLTVDLTTDTKPTTGGSGSGLTGDLRYCIDQADSNNQANTIVFDPTIFNTPQTITLGGTELVLSDTGGKQTITGPAAAVTISGENISGILQVDYTVTSSISGLTFSRGSVGSEGGAIANAGTLTLTSCVITDNSAGAFGGGIANIESLTLTDCTLSGNSSGIIGGGIGNRGELTLTNCTVSSNSAGLSGGGIENSGSLTLNDSTVSSNSAREDGGGLDGSTGEISLTGSTISGNSAVEGGGIAIASGSLTITTSTISGNAAQGAAGKDGTAGAHGSNYTPSNRYEGSGKNGSSGESGGSAEGGGLFVASGTVDLMSSTFSDNTAEGGAGGKASHVESWPDAVFDYRYGPSPDPPVRACFTNVVLSDVMNKRPPLSPPGSHLVILVYQGSDPTQPYPTLMIRDRASRFSTVFHLGDIRRCSAFVRMVAL